jgi:TonB-dependent SusC/RagA subfamily outer membrane receptor
VASDPASREPLFIVDEIIQVRRPNLEALEGRIESIEVVKGAAARILYGDRGRNGVIRITMKRR